MSCCRITRKTVTWRAFQRWYYYTGTSVSGNMDSSVEIGDRTARDIDRPFVPVPLFSLRREEWRANGSIMRSLAAVHAIMQGGLVADKETKGPGHLARLLPRKPKSFALLVGVACILSPCSRRRLWQIFKRSCQHYNSAGSPHVYVCTFRSLAARLCIHGIASFRIIYTVAAWLHSHVVCSCSGMDSVFVCCVEQRQQSAPFEISAIRIVTNYSVLYLLAKMTKRHRPMWCPITFVQLRSCSYLDLMKPCGRNVVLKHVLFLFLDIIQS